jgi:8-amino-3,8-dideoxy-alpha-D-manno-octulosonate transaminase
MSKHPLIVEIEINSNCNLRCSYCPNSIEGYASTKEMNKSVYETLLKQLKDEGYKGKLAFDFYNEPTDTPSFDWFVSTANEILPNSFLSLYTNGTKILDRKMLEGMIDNGVDEILITKHEGIKKLPIESFYHDLAFSVKSKVTVRSHDDLTLTNRSGTLNVGTTEDYSSSPCSIPAMMLTVTVDGDVLPCFEDAYRKEVLGNIKEHNVIDIWNNPKSNEFKCELAKGNRSNFDICKNCNRSDKDLSKLKMEKHFLGDEEVDAISKVLKSGELFRYQSKQSLCQQFENGISKKFNTPYAHLVTSGTNALVCSLMAAGVSKGDEVIIPSYTFVATATAVLMSGAIPVVCDVDETLLIKPESINNLITEKTKAIVPVHMDGLACDMDSIMSIAKDNKLIVIEDVAQAKGGMYKDKYLGTIGDFGCFSYNKDKILTAGEGGLVITKTRENYERICCISDGAYSFSPHHQNFFKEIEPFLGFSMRVSEITGAILNIQLEKMDLILKKYRKLKLIFNEQFIDNSIVKNSLGHDFHGDCGICILLNCNDPKIAAAIGSRLRDNHIIAAPPSIRPAHVAWKWGKMLKKNPFFHQSRNPYEAVEKEYNYSPFNFLDSINNVAKTIRIEVDIHWSESEMKRLVQIVNDTIIEFE